MFLLTETVEYLGHLISPVKLEDAKRTYDAVKGLRPLTSVPTMRSFLGL